jgi:PiT family inorganic phosphate transporter
MGGADLLVLGAVLAVAYANGANDSFKGVATLYGGGAASYRVALFWAVGTTLAGSLVAAFLAEGLIKAFSGAGLVPVSVLADPAFITAVALGAAFTVFATALAGIPISTTHALTGALAGAGLLAAGSDLKLGVLGGAFFLPLALSPLLSVMLVATLYPAFLRLTRRFGLTQTSCICIGTMQTVSASEGAAVLSRHFAYASETVDCPPTEPDAFWKFDIAPLLRRVHFVSAGAVSFARGVNDTPKIIGIALAAGAFELEASVVAIALTMALGGLLHSYRIARTMSERILPFNEAEGTLANLVTSGMVISASVFGLPVSTTHVSVGSLFGLGAAKGEMRWTVAGGIAISWLLTLPAALAAAALVYLLIG